MILYKNVNTIRSFVISKKALPEEEFHVVSNQISDDSVLEPIISSDILEAISSIPGGFLSDGFSISIL